MRLGVPHTFACGPEPHDHEFGVCCAPDCWCNQPETRMLGIGADHCSHEPNELCTIEGWHQHAECRAFTYPDGSTRPRKLIWLDGNGRWPD